MLLCLVSCPCLLCYETSLLLPTLQLLKDKPLNPFTPVLPGIQYKCTSIAKKKKKKLLLLLLLQLYINYKLKSVAALPWRQMTFKFLNTIVDDLFAFVIKMPWLHRLSVFRDDLVFLVYIYQRWAYRVDKRRPNEFGYAPLLCTWGRGGVPATVPLLLSKAHGGTVGDAFVAIKGGEGHGGGVLGVRRGGRGL